MASFFCLFLNINFQIKSINPKKQYQSINQSNSFSNHSTTTTIAIDHHQFNNLSASFFFLCFEKKQINKQNQVKKEKKFKCHVVVVVVGICTNVVFFPFYCYSSSSSFIWFCFRGFIDRLIMVYCRWMDGRQIFFCSKTLFVFFVLFLF